VSFVKFYHRIDTDTSPSCLGRTVLRTHEDERTVLFKTISLDGIKPNTNPNPEINLNPKLTMLSGFYVFFRAPSHDLQTSRTF